MEIRAIGQGGQATIDFSRSNDKSVELNSMQPLENNKGDDKVTKDTDIKEKDLRNAVDKLNKFLEDNKTHAEYEIHDKFKDIMIRIVDDKTGKVIQEVPPKKILDMVAKMLEMVGVLFDKKA